MPVFCWVNYNLALHGNYCVSNWFSLPFAYKRKWEREVSPPVGEVARSARGVDRQNKALTLCALARSKTIQKR